MNFREKVTANTTCLRENMLMVAVLSSLAIMAFGFWTENMGVALGGSVLLALSAYTLGDSNESD